MKIIDSFWGRLIVSILFSAIITVPLNEQVVKIALPACIIYILIVLGQISSYRKRKNRKFLKQKDISNNHKF